ncbi:MAG: hypothetical protein DRQ55_01625 [Planctomycetota bacterium]|nr:MAG: hypothetical protein DRQ55_01625 [Planctomycetota bacterium]
MIVLLFLLAVVASALFAGLETGLYTTSRLRLHLDAQAGSRPAAQARRLLADMPSLLSVLLVSNNLANHAATLLAQVALAQWGALSGMGASRELVGSLGVTCILFLLAESVPKNAYRRRRERLLYPTVWVVSVMRVVLLPLSRPVAAVARLLQGALRRRVGGAAGSPGMAQLMLATGAEEGFLTAFQERVAHGVLAMRGRKVGSEAQPIEAFARARLGAAGLDLPPGCRAARVLVLDASGQRCAGWVPMASLWTPDGFRAPARAELRPVMQVSESTSLDAVYLGLDQSSSPFAVVRRPDGLSVLDADHMRQRVMGRFESDAAAPPVLA